jgi:anti-anti-sigma factor
MDNSTWTRSPGAAAAQDVRRHEVRVLSLAGELDITTREMLRRRLSDALAHASAGVDIDVRAVTFMDANTVGVLLNAHQDASRTGRPVRITGAGDQIRAVIRVCGAGILLSDGDLTAAGDVPSPGTATSPSPALPAPADRTPPSAATRARIVRESWEQQRIDAEVRSSRRMLLARLRARVAVDPMALIDSGFLAVADRTTVHQAIVATAATVGAADACDLQLYHRPTRSLRMAHQQGFDTAFLDYFATVDADAPTACATALHHGKPVLIDDITHSPIFAGQATLAVMLAAGTRAVWSYPLYDHAHLPIGVLSFHYHAPRPRSGNPGSVAWAAAYALVATGSR